METQERIDKWAEFLELYYKEKIIENARADKKRVTIEFKDLVLYDSQLADDLIDNPDEVLKEGDMALEQLDMLGVVKGFKVRVRGDIPGMKMRIRDLRAKHLNKFITIEGTIETKTDVVPKVTHARWECPSCGSVLNVLYLGKDILNEPARCSCGRKGKFRELPDKTMIDCFSITLQELSSAITYGSSLATKPLLCQMDLTDTIIEEKLIEGTKITVNGIYREKAIVKGGQRMTHLVTYVDVNYIKISEESFYDVEISCKDEESIKRFVVAHRVALMDTVKEGLFQGVYGLEDIKTALTLQAFGGVSDYTTIPRTRGDIHIALTGDAGVNKTVFLEYVRSFHPKARMAIGKTVSVPGLSGTVKRDELTGNFVLKPGTIPLANNGMCCIGEGQKIMTGRGLVNIEDVMVGDEIISYNNGLERNKVLRTIDNGLKEIIVIWMYSGDRIECTKDHLILTGKGWMQADQLTNDMFIKIPFSNPSVTIQDEYEKGFIMGFALCDIWYNSSLRKGSKKCIKNVLSFASCVKNTERAGHICKLLKRQYGIHNIHSYQRAGLGRMLNGKLANFKESTSISFSSKLLHKQVKDMFEKNLLPYSTDSFYIGFLASILSTDCCISHKKGKQGIKHEIAITITRNHKSKSINLNIMTMVNALFHRYGILSVIRGDKIIISSVYSYNRVYEIFSRYIIGIKREKLYHVKPKHQIATYDTLLDEKYTAWFCSIKFNTSKTVRLGVHSRIYMAVRKKRVSLQLMGTLKKHWATITNAPFVEPEKQYLLNKVKEVTTKGISKVYDLTIDKTQNFCLTGGVVHNCIDEFDKMDIEDRDILLEPMESQTITISKADLADRQMLAREAFLVSMNPKNSYFNDNTPIYEQLNIPQTLVSRFDLIYVIKRNKDKSAESQKREFEKAQLMMARTKGDKQEKLKRFHQFMRKYIAYAKQKVTPKWPEDLAAEYLPGMYAGMEHSSKGYEQDAKDSFPVTARYLFVIKRLAEARRRMFLETEITKEDVDFAIHLISNTLKEFAMNFETGKIDEELVMDGVSSMSKKLNEVFDKLYDELEIKDSRKIVFKDELVDVLKDKGFDDFRIREFLERKVKMGDIIYPRGERVGHMLRLNR